MKLNHLASPGRLRFLSASLVLLVVTAVRAPAQSIACPTNAPPNMKLAAKEVRRYVFLRTGTLMTIRPEASGPSVVLAIDPALGREEFRLQGGDDVLRIAGGSDVAVLYGAYAFAEKLGVRFYLHGDVLPDDRIPLAIPRLDETNRPAFSIRGIQPFHDFTQGPDLWEVDDYKAVLSQMVKLRMNFIGLHTYSETGWGSEPTVWIGMPEDVGQGPRPASSYASYYANTERTTGGQKARSAAIFGYGARELFETDAWGPSVMRGLMPCGKTGEEKNEVFVRAGRLLNEAFTYAHRFGVKTCVGTEIPLTHPSRLLPIEVRARLKEYGKSVGDPGVLQALYKGIFLRAIQTYPIDYYWLWTPESWRLPQSDATTQAAQNDLLAAVDAAKEVHAPFTLATAGWTLGPSKDRAMFDRLLPRDMPFSCINLELGTVPVDEGFTRLKGRPGWAIPWMENDLSMNSPQLWVGRIQRDAYDAARYGCSGLMGIHWRTEEIGPMVGALAQAQWRVPEPQKGAEHATAAIVVHGGNATGFWAPVAGTNASPVYQSVRWDTAGYDIAVPNGSYRVTLQFNEPAYDRVGARVFGVALQGHIVERRLDIFERAGKNHALDLVYDKVEVKQGLVSIGFLKDIASQLLEADRKEMDAGYADYPCIAGIVIEGPKTVRINCGGPAWGDYQADAGPVALPRYLPSDTFYLDWAAHQFGPEASDRIAAIFARIDGYLPTPATGCPGGLNPNGAPWEQARKAYDFVDELEQLRPAIRGAGQQSRFAKWVNYFAYLRATGKAGCACGELDRLMGQMAGIKDTAARVQFAKDVVLPSRIRLNEAWGDMITLAIEVADTWGGIGVVMGQELMNRGEQNRLERHDPAIRAALGTDLPTAALPWMEYRGAAKLIVPTARSVVAKGDITTLRIVALDRQPVKSVHAFVRPLGGGSWTSVAATNIGRAVYRAELPAAQDDLEYRVEAETSGGAKLAWPATAPQINQTVVVTD